MCGWIRPAGARIGWHWWRTQREGLLQVTVVRQAHRRDAWLLVLHDADAVEHWTYVTWEALMSSFVRRLIDEKQADTGESVVAHDDDLSDLAPKVHELCVTAMKRKGRRYDPAGIFIYASQGCWYASLTHKATDFKRRGEGGTIREALKNLEERVAKVGDEGPMHRNRTRKAPDNGQKAP